MRSLCGIALACALSVLGHAADAADTVRELAYSRQHGIAFYVTETQDGWCAPRVPVAVVVGDPGVIASGVLAVQVEKLGPMARERCGELARLDLVVVTRLGAPPIARGEAVAAADWRPSLRPADEEAAHVHKASATDAPAPTTPAATDRFVTRPLERPDIVLKTRDGSCAVRMPQRALAPELRRAATVDLSGFSCEDGWAQGRGVVGFVTREGARLVALELGALAGYLVRRQEPLGLPLIARGDNTLQDWPMLTAEIGRTSPGAAPIMALFLSAKPLPFFVWCEGPAEQPPTVLVETTDENSFLDEARIDRWLAPVTQAIEKTCPRRDAFRIVAVPEVLSGKPLESVALFHTVLRREKGEWGWFSGPPDTRNFVIERRSEARRAAQARIDVEAARLAALDVPGRAADLAGFALSGYGSLADPQLVGRLALGGTERPVYELVRLYRQGDGFWQADWPRPLRLSGLPADPALRVGGWLLVAGRASSDGLAAVNYRGVEFPVPALSIAVEHIAPCTEAACAEYRDPLALALRKLGPLPP
ncbi:MAG: hypothetical protein ACT7A5_27025 [Ferrovibrionaceae bacterium]